MPDLEPTPITVIGAGPAGIMAARAAADTGLDVTLIDENPLPGGQYYRQSPPEFKFALPSAGLSGRADAPAVLAQLDHPKIRTLSNTLVWGVFDQGTLGLACGEQSFTLPTDRVILATGAYDRPLAFPGWTLPGIMGAAAAMRLLKTQWVLPGRRILLAGLGPLQLALADALVRAGAEVVAVVEAANPLQGLGQLPKFWGHWDRVREAITYTSTLARHRVPVLYNHAIISAAGAESVEQATIARLDEQGAPVPGTEKTYSVDTVCLGYGLLPAFQIAAAFGCQLGFNSSLRWFTPRHNAVMETTQSGIFVAGDAAGIAGAKAALLAGQVAGLAAAAQLGALGSQALAERLSPLLARLAPLNRLAEALQHIYAFRPGLDSLAKDDTLICRCEEVTAGQVRSAVAEGAADLHQVKLATRAGMGYCQGRFCSVLVAPLIAAATGQPVGSLEPFTVRPPLHPVPLKILASAEVEKVAL